MNNYNIFIVIFVNIIKKFECVKKRTFRKYLNFYCKKYESVLK